MYDGGCYVPILYPSMSVSLVCASFVSACIPRNKYKELITPPLTICTH